MNGARPIAVSAPGKLFLVGEYAVLEGAPALLAAVDRRVRVCLAPAVDGRWSISAPNLGIRDLDLGARAALPGTLDAAVRARLALFDAVRKTVGDVLDAAIAPMQVVIDSRQFERRGHKLGLGSSAAVAAALTYALALAAGRDLPRAALARLAIGAHRRAQGTSGSGGDVAAAVYGGIISYRRDRPPRVLAWPESLAGMTLVTGFGARTADLVARVFAYKERDPSAYKADMRLLSELADKAQHELATAAGFIDFADAYFAALKRLDDHARAGIVTPRHRALHRLATRYHGVFKTSGAGGGDIGLAFIARGRDERVLRTAFEHAGVEIVPLAFGAPGVCCDDPAPPRQPPARSLR